MKNILLFFLLFLFMEGVFGETDETVSVMKGDSVTLHTSLTKIPSNDVIDWSFGKNEDRIARLNTNKNITTMYDAVLDGAFRDRLNVDIQTGDLTIRNMKTTDTGIYEVAGKHAPNKRFNVTVEQYEADENQLVSVLLGDSVTLQTDAVDILRYNMIRWRCDCEESPVAEINRTARNISTYDDANKRFRHRLQLDYLTGSLTIKNIGIKHSGLYEVDISSNSKHTIHKSFNVTVSGSIKSESVMEGGFVTLQTYTNIQIYDFLLWMFQDIVIAEIHKAAQRFFIYDADERFRDRLQLNNQTGSLNITDIRTTDSGVYELRISSSRHTIHKKIIVTVVGEIKLVSVMEGDSVILHTDLTEIQRDEQILWMFLDTRVAEIYKTDQRFYTHDRADERFRGRLQLDDQTGSLTIMNIRTSDSGRYELKINSSRHSIHKRFNVAVTSLPSGETVGIVVAVLLIAAAAGAAVGVICHCRKISTLERKQVEAISVTKGDFIILKTNAKIQTEDQILWLFGETCIAEINGEAREITVHDVLNGRFRDRLKLNSQTGYLIITDITTEHNGFYKLQIIRSGKVLSKIFSVTVSDKAGLGINNPEEQPLTRVDTSNSRL